MRTFAKNLPYSFTVQVFLKIISFRTINKTKRRHSENLMNLVLVILLAIGIALAMNNDNNLHPNPQVQQDQRLIYGVRQFGFNTNNENQNDFLNPSNVPLAKPIALAVEDNQYVQLPTGNPGKFNKYRLDHNLNITYLYDFPTSYSQTHNDYSELLYFGDVKIRLPVCYGLPPTNYDARLYGIKHDGVLALGSGSDIWKYWHVATISSSRVDLGRFNLNSYVTSSPGILLKYSESLPCTVGNKSYSIRFDPRQDISLFPHELFHQKTFDVLHSYDITYCEKWCERMRFPLSGISSVCLGNKGETSFDHLSLLLSVSDIDYSSSTQTKHVVPISKINTIRPQEIVLGRLFMDKMVIHIDRISESMIITPSFSRFRETHPDCTTNTYLGLAICITYITWVLTVNSETPNEETNRIFFGLLQLYGSILVFCAFSYNLYGIEIWKFYCHLVDSGITWLYDIGILLVPVFTFLNIASVIMVFRNDKNSVVISSTFESLDFQQGFSILSRWEQVGLMNRLFFETALLWSLWITLLEGHYDAGGVLYLIAVATLLCCNHLVITLMLFVRDTLLWIPSCVLFLFSFIFLLHSNVLPYITLQMFQNPFKWELSATYVSMFVFIPSLFILVHIERALIFCRLQLTKYSVSKQY